MSISSALRFSILDRYSGLVINFVVSLILARLLTPDELGVFSITMVILAVVQTVRDMGAGTYIIQEQELTTDRIRATWTVQLTLGGLIALFVLLLAHPVAMFYHDMRMREVLWLLALNFAINPIGAITASLLIRNMEFKKIAIVRLCGAVTGGAVSIGFAMNEFGPASLALGSVATTIISAILLSRHRPDDLPWRPGFKEVRHVLSIGTKLTGAVLINSLAKATPEASLGRLQGMTSTGLYARATGLISLFDRLVMDALNSIMLPTFSALKRESIDPTETFMRAFAILTTLGFTFFLTLSRLAEYAIVLLYGEQWLPASDTAMILCLNGAFILPTALIRPLLIADGRIQQAFSLSVIAGALTIGASIVGARHGLDALAYGLSIATAISTVIWLRAAQRSLTSGPGRMFLAVFRSVLIALSTNVPLLMLPAFAPGILITQPLHVAAPIVGALVAFLVALRLINPDSFTQILIFLKIRPAPFFN